ncbi:MAG: excisionase family DNA-binding protein [Planctomycetes bacterium]|nr:excisionase family DNA-binding protein [Planctomycetota bacterium]
MSLLPQTALPPNVEIEPRYLAAGEAAKRLGFSRSFLYLLLRRGMPSLRVGRRRLISIDAVRAWLEGNFSDGEWPRPPVRSRARRPRQGGQR